MLNPQEVYPFLFHDDRLVRRVAADYFDSASNFGPLTADDLWRLIDRSGDRHERRDYLHLLKCAPTTILAIDRLLAALAEPSSGSDLFALQSALTDVPYELLRQHRDAILGNPNLAPHVRSHLEKRLELADLAPVDAWNRLLEFGVLNNNLYVSEIDQQIVDRYIECAARGGSQIAELALQTLDDPAESEDWNEVFAVQMIEALRYAPAIDALLQKLLIDADYLPDRVVHALSAIGTVEVVEKLAAFYPGKQWHTRLYADEPLRRIKLPESEAALIKLIDVEEDDDLRLHLCGDLCDLCSLTGLAAARELLDPSSSDPDDVKLMGKFVGVSIMLNQPFDEVPAWRRTNDEADRRMLQKMDDLESAEWIVERQKNWLATGVSGAVADSDPLDDEDDAIDLGDLGPLQDRLSPPETFVREESKVGRNDPCPCGSGKKYKKCCLK